MDTFELKHLVGDIQQMDYFSFKTQYLGPDPQCANAITDAPIMIISVSTKGQSRSIIHSRSCKGAIPDKLTALEERIDMLAHASQWE